MSRTRSGKSLSEFVTMLAVLLGLSGMLAYSVGKVCAVGLAPHERQVSVNLKTSPP